MAIFSLGYKYCYPEVECHKYQMHNLRMTQINHNQDTAESHDTSNSKQTTTMTE